MNVRTIPRSVFTTSLRLARLPADVVLGLLPGDGTGAPGKARLVIDRADATTRTFVGTVTLDSQLREDGRQRRLAADERRRALDLREAADRVSDEARETSERRQDEAQHQRRRAESRARNRRQEANREREQRQRRAARSEAQRKQASRELEAREEQQIEEQAPQARLDVLESQAEAQLVREQALLEADEAARLGQTAAAVKEERKEQADS